MKDFSLLFQNRPEQFVGRKCLITIAFFIACLFSGSHLANAQATQPTIGVQGTACNGMSITLYLQGGSGCPGMKVTSASSWSLPGATNIVYSGNFLSVSATWTAVGTYSVGVGFSCTGGSGSAQQNVVIGQTVTPTVSMSLSNNGTICQGSNLTFTATGTNVGTTPSYTFFIDGVSMPTSAATTYSPTSLAVGSHTAYVRLTSSLGCASPTFINSTTIPFTVSPVIPFTATLQGPGVICAGSPAQFTVTPSAVYGGTISYKWFLNGTQIANQTASTLQSVVTQGATIYCVVTSTSSCLTNQQVQTSPFTANLNPPVLTVSQTGFCTSSGSATGSVTLTVAGVPNENKTWQYQYKDNSGGYSGWTTIASNTASSQNFTWSGTTGVRSYNFQVICSTSTCSKASSSQILPITSTPTATAASPTFFVGTAMNISPLTAFPNMTYSYTIPSATNIATSSISNPLTAVGSNLALINGSIPGSANLSIIPTVNGCVGPAFSTTVYIYPMPVITASSKNVVLGGSVTLSAQSFYDGYQWQGITGTNIDLVNKPGTYTLIVTKNGVNSPSVSITIDGQLDDENMNYIVSNNILADNITDPTAIAGLPVSSNNQSIEYFDGLGRPLQKVVTQGSPVISGSPSLSKLDMVQPIYYDANGRESRTYLPFAADNTGLYKKNVLDINGNYAGIASGFYSTTGDKIVDDSQPYSMTVFELSPLNRTLQEYGVGAAWSSGTGSNKFVQNKYLINNAGQEQVIVWEVDNTTGLPTRLTSYNGGYYQSGDLAIKSVTDENGNEQRVYTDKDGHQILRKVQNVSGAGLNDPTNTNWTQTYYIYDDAGLLRYTLQPELVKYIIQKPGTYTPIQTDLDGMAFQYIYDYRNRLSQKKIPGAGWMYLVYDMRDRIVMTQDANQRAVFQWSVTKYDNLNRPIITAFYNPGSAVDLPTMSGQISTTLFSESYIGSSGESFHGYSNTVFPTTNLTVWTVKYYDNYKFITDLSEFGNNYNYSANDISPNQEPTNFPLMIGAMTGEKLWAVSVFLKAVTYFDAKARPIQTLADNNKGGIDRTTHVVDFAGRILYSKMTHATATHAPQTIAERYIYDHMSRLTTLFHTVNTNQEVMLFQNSYNKIGQLVLKGLHSTDGGVTTKQNVDYRYNIRGWLQSMNNSQLKNDGGITNSDDDGVDYFGFELAYNTAFTTGTNTGNLPQYNGNISAMKWSHYSADPVTDVAYNYGYDPNNRLMSAMFLTDLNGVGAWANSLGQFNVPTYTYDQNGNIGKLKRNDGSGSATPMDDLTYTYLPLSNQLSNVGDAGNPSSGFIDVNTSSDYTYDANGNLSTDLNKGITTINYNYPGMNLPSVIIKNTGEWVMFYYDASGTKLTELDYVPTNVLKKTTEYDGPFVYVNDVLQFINHEEGRVVMTGATPEYQYNLKDHLGNVRLTFTTQAIASSVAYAGYEDPYESSQFSSYGGVRTTNAAHTGSNSIMLSGGYAGVMGTGNTYHMYPGDKVDLNGYVLSYGRYNAGGTGASNFAAILLDAFHLVAPAVGEINTAASALNSFGMMEAGGYGDGSQDETDVRLFFTILAFDKNYNFINVTYKQSKDDSQWDYIDVNYTANQECFVYVYVSMEDNVASDIYVDDVTMTLTPSPIIQYNEYYPYGLQNQNSWTRTGIVSQNYLYNGKEQINDLGLNWYDYGARMYMPEIGRWGVIDPLAENFMSLSPYAYALDNPISFVDMEGLSPGDPKYTASGNVVIIIADNPTDYGDFWDPSTLKDTKWDYGVFLTATKALEWVQSTYGKDGKGINNLIIRSHGTTGRNGDQNDASMYLNLNSGYDEQLYGSDFGNSSGANDNVKAILGIASYLKENGYVALTACGISQYGSAFARAFFRAMNGAKKSLTLYTNGSNTALSWSDGRIRRNHHISEANVPWKPWHALTKNGSMALSTLPGLGANGNFIFYHPAKGKSRDYDREAMIRHSKDGK